MVTKNKRIDLRGSAYDERNIRKAAERLGTVKVSDTIFNAVEQVANSPIEYGCDRPAIRDTITNIEYGQKYLQLFVNEFLELTGTTLTRDELEQTFLGINKVGSSLTIENAIRELLRAKLYQQLKAAHPDMTISFDNVPPKDLTRLFEIADQLDNAPGIKLRFCGVYWSAYEVNKGQVTIIESEVQRLTDGYRFTAKNADELQKLSKVQKLCAVMNELLEDKEIVPEKIFALVYYDNEAAKYSPSGAYIKYSLQPNILFH